MTLYSGACGKPSPKDKYYPKTKKARAKLAGGEHGHEAVRYLAKYISGKKAPPGFSNHSDGRAVDFGTLEGATKLVGEVELNERWKKSWLHKWLVRRAAESRIQAARNRGVALGLSSVKWTVCVPILFAPLFGCSPKPGVDQGLSSARLSPQLFLALDKDGAIVSYDGDGRQVEVLERGPFSGAVLDAELDLIWVRRSDRLEVIDLRVSRLLPILIATGIAQEAAWSILQRRGGAMRVVEPMSVCEHEIALEWHEESRIADLGAEPDAIVSPAIVNTDWLQHERRRRENDTPLRSDYSAPSLPRLELPQSRADCDEPDDCGRYVAFGMSQLRLVMVQSRAGADCVHYACLVQDSSTGNFATPPALQQWGQAIDTTRPVRPLSLRRHPAQVAT